MTITRAPYLKIVSEKSKTHPAFTKVYLVVNEGEIDISGIVRGIQFNSRVDLVNMVSLDFVAEVEAPELGGEMSPKTERILKEIAEAYRKTKEG